MNDKSTRPGITHNDASNETTRTDADERKTSRESPGRWQREYSTHYSSPIHLHPFPSIEVPGSHGNFTASHTHHTGVELPAQLDRDIDNQRRERNFPQTTQHIKFKGHSPSSGGQIDPISSEITPIPARLENVAGGKRSGQDRQGPRSCEDPEPAAEGNDVVRSHSLPKRG